MSTFNTEDRITMSDLAQSLRDAIDAKAKNIDFTNHAGNNDIHVTTTNKDAWNSAKSIADEVVNFASGTGNINRVKAYVDGLVDTINTKITQITSALSNALGILSQHTFRLDTAETNIGNNTQDIEDINTDLLARTKQTIIMKGTVNLGETIPLPTGFTEAQCKWFVTFKKVYNPNADKANFQINDTTRTITMKYEWYNATTGNTVTEDVTTAHALYGTTSFTYVIIGVKIGSDT